MIHLQSTRRRNRFVTCFAWLHTRTDSEKKRLALALPLTILLPLNQSPSPRVCDFILIRSDWYVMSVLFMQPGSTYDTVGLGSVRRTQVEECAFLGDYFQQQISACILAVLAQELCMWGSEQIALQSSSIHVSPTSALLETSSHPLRRWKETMREERWDVLLRDGSVTTSRFWWVWQPITSAVRQLSRLESLLDACAHMLFASAYQEKCFLSVTCNLFKKQPNDGYHEWQAASCVPTMHSVLLRGAGGISTDRVHSYNLILMCICIYY